MDGQINRKESATSRKVVNLPLLTKRLAPIALNLLYACVPQANANQGESASINIIGRAIDNQRQNNIYIAYSKLSPEQLGQVGINEAQLSQSLGIESQVKSANLVVGLNPKNGEEAPIVVRLVSYENMTNIVLFEKENEAGLEATEFQTGFLADKDNNLSFGLYIQTKDKDGNTLVVPFLEAKSSVNINDVNPDLVNRAKAGDQQAIEEIRSIILSEDKLNSITLTNPISGRLFTDDKNGANWEKTMTNLVELLTNPTTVHAAGLPTPTVPQPTLTQEPTPTPIVTEPTTTPTEVVLTPEQQLAEYLQTAEAKQSINQFVNAMKMADIEVTREEVTQGIAFQELKDKDGNAVYNLDPDPAQTGETLEGPISLAIAQKNENGKYEWRPYSHGEISSLIGITTGVSTSILNPTSNNLDNFNQTYLCDALWKIPYSSSSSLYLREGSINPQPLISSVSSVLSRDQTRELMVSHLIWGNLYVLPDWLINGSYSKESLKSIVMDYIITVMTPLKGKVNRWIVVNEPFASPWDPNNTGFWQKELGPDYNWIVDAFETAHNVDPSAVLTLNDFGIEIPGEKLYDQSKANKIFEIVSEIKSRGIPIEVGFQMHLYGSQFSNPQTLQQLSEKFRQNIRIYKEIGIGVNITEWDIRMNNVPGSPQERQLKQANIYKTLMKVALEEGVKSINFFGVDDSKSWLEDPAIGGSDAKNSNPTLRAESGLPKPAWFAINQAILEYIESSSQ